MNGELGPIERKAIRRSIFSDGRIVSHSATFPVRIRNVSEVGALVDGNELPAAGETVTLENAFASVLATVSWSKGNRAGLKFVGSTHLSDWFPQGAAPPSTRSSSAGRRQSDRAGDPASDAPSSFDRDRMIAGKLIDAASIIETLLLKDLVDNSPRRHGPTVNQQMDSSLALLNDAIEMLVKTRRD